MDLQKKSLHNKLDVKYESIIKPKRYNEKMTRVDLLVEYDDTIVNIEMYRKLNNESITKSNHYIMKTFSNIDQSERYRNSKKVIQLNFVDGVMQNILPDKVLTTFQLQSIDDYHFILEKDKFKIIYLRLDKVSDEIYNEIDLEKTKILKYFRAKNSEERRKIAEGDDLMMKHSAWIDDFVNDYKYKKYMSDWADEIAKDKIKEIAYEDGDRKAKRNIIKNMLKQKLSIDDISRFTGIPKEDVLSYR